MCVCLAYVALIIRSVLQAQDNIMNLPLANGWGEKHHLLVKWKYVEAKVICFSTLFLHSRARAILNASRIVILLRTRDMFCCNDLPGCSLLLPRFDS